MFLGIGFYQTSICIMEYLAYPVSTSVYSENLQFYGKDAYKLPDITVCNMNPLSARAYNHSEPSSFTSYINLFDLVDELVSDGNASGIDVVELWKAEKMAVSSYYAWVGPDYAAELGHTKEEFIASCSVLILKGMSNVKRPCLSYVKVKPFMHPRYFNCFTISTESMTIDSNIVVGYSLTFQLSNYEARFYEFMADPSKYGMGAVVTVQEHDTYPVIA